MPTLDQLPTALAASDTDELLVSQGGIARKMTRAQLLVGLQQSLSLAAGEILVGPSSGVGAPQTVTLGSNLILANGTLSASGPTYSISSLMPGTTPTASNLVGVSQSGTDASVSYAMFMSGLSGLSGINLSSHSVVPTGSSTAQSLANFAANTLPRTGGQLTGPLLLAADPTQPSQAATKRYVDNSSAAPSTLIAGGKVLPLGPNVLQLRLTGSGQMTTDGTGIPSTSNTVNIADNTAASLAIRVCIKSGGNIAEWRANGQLARATGAATTTWNGDQDPVVYLQTGTLAPTTSVNFEADTVNGGLAVTISNAPSAAPAIALIEAI
ncbi:MAG: hypothetical protein JOY71_23685 [Acetobacteraceae bacterium]|nr:hypothetical protein [Acetobacteraceae bacterium]